MFSIVLCKLAGTDDPTYMSRQLLHEQTIMFVQSVARTVLLQKIIDAPQFDLEARRQRSGQCRRLRAAMCAAMASAPFVEQHANPL